MARQEEIIIEVEVNAGDAAQKLAQTKNSIAELKAEQKSLNAAIKENGSVTAEQAQRLAEISGELKDLSRDEKMYTSQLNTATGGNKEFGKSLATMSIELAKMKAEYRNMSKEMRESDAGKQLQASIQSLDKTMKDADAELGDFGRNVGNYQSALLGLGGNATKVASLFKNGFANGISAAKTSLEAFGKTMLATPFGVALIAIRGLTIAFNGMRDAIKRSDDASTEMAKNMAQVEALKSRWRDGWNQIATATVTSITKIIDGLDELDRRMASSWFGRKSKEDAEAMANATRKVRKEWEWLITAEDKLEDARREYSLRSADRQRKIAELSDKAYNAEKYTHNQRKAFYEEMIEIEKKDLEERREIANENVSLVIKRNKLMGDSSDAAKDRETQARLELKRVDTDYYNFQAGITRRLSSLNNKISSSYNDTAKDVVAAKKKANDELRKLEDLQNQMIEDELERRRAEIRKSADREIEDINKRLEEEKNLTAKARTTMAEQVVLIRQKMYKDLADVDEEELKKASEAVAKMDEDAAKRAADAQAAEAERLRGVYEQQTQELANSIQDRLNAVYGNVVAASEIELEAAQTNYDRSKEMDAETRAAMFGSEEAYKNAVLQAEAQIMDARQHNEDAIKAQATEVAQTMQAVTGAMSSMFEAAAGDSEAYEKFKKAMAIADAAISLAQTIAAATSASTAGDPYTMAIRIAANVAAVTAQFAAVIKAIKAATIPSAPKFAEGGVVPGTSYTGDKVLIRANSGERVLTKEMSDNLVQLLARGVPAWGMDYERLERAFERAASRIPAPVLDYSEFVAYGDKVRMEQKRLSEY